jgi:hypothetical protein
MRCLGRSELLELNSSKGFHGILCILVTEDDGHLFLSKSKSFLHCNGHLVLKGIMGLVRRKIQTVKADRLLVNVGGWRI